jgi:predicted GNAT superfamily acetyltransferase
VTTVEIRPLRGLEEYARCVDLQEQTWGPDFEHRVPASILMVAAETGGVISGALEGGRLLGFVFGISGLRDGRPVHWSDMLAVRPEARDRGLGLRLKLHQRALLLERGIDRVLWTFDPLESRNAYLNLHKLGATVRSYRRDFYGASDSPLHAGIGTDRLVADWRITSDRVLSRIAGGAPASGGRAPGVDTVRVAIPPDIQALKRVDLDRAAAWRSRVREALEARLAEGFVAVDLERGPDRSHYVLTRPLSE